MKIICKDNFDRDYISERLVAENVSEYYAKIIVRLLNESEPVDGAYFYKAESDDYKLYKFIP
jgi:hypothetical protein